MSAKEPRSVGGPAFPGPVAANQFGHPVYARHDGMTLRDYFAAQALIGFAMHMDSHTRRKYLDGTAEGREAAAAYCLADAMLEEREK